MPMTSDYRPLMVVPGRRYKVTVLAVKGLGLLLWKRWADRSRLSIAYGPSEEILWEGRHFDLWVVGRYKTEIDDFFGEGVARRISLRRTLEVSE